MRIHVGEHILRLAKGQCSANPPSPQSSGHKQSKHRDTTLQGVPIWIYLAGLLYVFRRGPGI